MSDQRGIATISGGEGSWRSAKLWRAHNPDALLLFVFTDTLYEDADTYRFLLQGIGEILGRPCAWIPQAAEFPDYRVLNDEPLAEYHGNPQWRAFLASLRVEAKTAFPELIWLVEGRDPWEVYRDERFVGNSRIDPCSKIIKRQLLARWLSQNANKATDVILFGIDEAERHRFDDGDGRGIRPRFAADGWTAAAPLIDYAGPHYSICHSPLEYFGLERQRLYRLGYMHANCGAFCCKAGKAHWQHRRRVHPDRFAYDRLMERKCREHIGTAAGTILTDAIGGRKRPLSLDDFDAVLSRSPEIFDYYPGDSGCGCMVDGLSPSAEVA